MMAELKLSGTLDFSGLLTLADKVTVDGQEVLVENDAQGNAPGPVLIPPPPGAPITTDVTVKVISSFNKTVKAGQKAIVTQGIVLQGNTWPGMVLPSSINSTVTVDHLAMNVVNDQATIFPSGMSAPLTTSGQ
jgi:hypothetical protein